MEDRWWTDGHRKNEELQEEGQNTNIQYTLPDSRAL
jgi:hypothetical protein